MKKIMALVLAAMLVLGICSFASAEAEVPEGYPAIIEGLDFGGAEVYIYDWWSDGTRSDDPSEDQQLQYDYWDWLEETYNVKIIQTALSDWAGNPTELANKVANKDDSVLCLIGISGGFAGDQYILLYNTYCNIEDWEEVRGASLEVAYKILMENGIQPFSGELLPI